MIGKSWKRGITLEANKKKPLYRKWWFISISAIFVLCVYSYLAMSPEERATLGTEDEAKVAQKEADIQAEQDKVQAAEAEAAKPENVARVALHKHFGKTNDFDETKDSIAKLQDDGTGSLYIEVFANDAVFSEKSAKRLIWKDVTGVLEDMKDNANIKTIKFGIVTPLSDDLGNSKVYVVMKLTFSPELRSKINWDGFDYLKIPDIAEDYWEHPTFKN